MGNFVVVGRRERGCTGLQSSENGLPFARLTQNKGSKYYWSFISTVSTNLLPYQGWTSCAISGLSPFHPHLHLPRFFLSVSSTSSQCKPETSVSQRTVFSEVIMLLSFIPPTQEGWHLGCVHLSSEWRKQMALQSAISLGLNLWFLVWWAILSSCTEPGLN